MTEEERREMPRLEDKLQNVCDESGLDDREIVKVLETLADIFRCSAEEGDRQSEDTT